MQIRAYLQEIQQAGFPFVELQTNGFLIPKQERWLAEWYLLGLTTVSISIVSQYPSKNKAIMGGSSDLPEAVKTLHEIGLSVRINCTMLKGGIDDWDGVQELINWCTCCRIEQLTIREVTAPPEGYGSENENMALFVREHELGRAADRILKSLEMEGTALLRLPHGAVVYDFHGQNVCLNNCLTPPKDEEIRQIIFFPDGHLRYDWVYPGAILL
jgi:molybdenum cofactor biosynthesis enzyme MoaA